MTLTNLEQFAKGFSAMRKAKVLAALDTSVQNNGMVLTRKELIEEMVAEGAVVTVAEGSKALMRPSGSYLLQKHITKTGIDYALFLIAIRSN